MALKGSEEKLAVAILSALFGVTDHGEAWRKVAKVILNHITENAVVTGTTPQGGPLTQGKIT